MLTARALTHHQNQLSTQSSTNLVLRFARHEDVRVDRVNSVRRQLAAGVYDADDMLDACLESLAVDLQIGS